SYTGNVKSVRMFFAGEAGKRPALVRRSSPPLNSSVRRQPTANMTKTLSSLKCAYCHEQFEFFSGTRHCNKCGAIFHDTCWFSQPLCSTYGCGGNISREEAREKRKDRVIGASYLVAIVSLFGSAALLRSPVLASSGLFVT